MEQKRYVMFYFILNYNDNIIFFMFYIKFFCIVFFLTNVESVISSYFLSQFFEALKELHKLQFLISIYTIIGSYTITIKYKQWTPNRGAVSGVS